MPLNSWFTPLSYRNWTMEMASFMMYLISYWTSQRVQIVAARIVVRASRYDHITSMLETLHWLPVWYRIEYKVVLMSFKALHLLVPSYIAGLLQFYQPSECCNHHQTLFGLYAVHISAIMVTMRCENVTLYTPSKDP